MRGRVGKKFLGKRFTVLSRGGDGRGVLQRANRVSGATALNEVRGG